MTKSCVFSRTLRVEKSESHNDRRSPAAAGPRAFLFEERPRWDNFDFKIPGQLVGFSWAQSQRDDIAEFRSIS